MPVPVLIVPAGVPLTLIVAAVPVNEDDTEPAGV